MAVFTVTTAADVVRPGDSVLSLREAVQQANATDAADTIRFADTLDGRTLELGNGQLTLTQDVAIDGGGSGITVDANSQSRVFAVTGAGTDISFSGIGITGGREREANGGGVLVGAGANLSLDGCTLSGNRAGHATYTYADGGAVFAEAGSRISLSGTTVRDNVSTRSGGGIATAADVTLRIEDSRLLDNQGANGGGIALEEGSSLALSRSLVSGNDAFAYRGGSGGGISASSSSILVSSSTISGNRGGYSGGGISADGSTVELVNSTVAGNAALSRLVFGDGGAISGSGTLSLASSTVTGNRAAGGVIELPDYFGGGGVSFSGSVRVANSAVVGNFSNDSYGVRRATDVGGTIASSNGHNLFGSDVDGAVAGDREGVAAATVFAAVDSATGGGRLALNGGPTPTVALRDAAGNPALSGAEPVAAGDADQRGVARSLPEGSNPDVGAFELDQAAVSRAASPNNDLLAGTAAADALAGRAGADWLEGRDGDDRLTGDSGGDTLLGGAGDDALDGGAGLDTASYRDAAGVVTASLLGQVSGGALGADRLSRVENLEGGRSGDTLTGDVLANALGGNDGTDRLFGLRGEDLLRGDAGADRLNGGLGADDLSGGAGRDAFAYGSFADSRPGIANRDLVLDFGDGGDRIDLRALDARSATAGDQAFVFLAREGAAFTGTGQVRWFQEDGRTFVEANVDAARGADLQLELTGLRDLTAADFVL